MLLAAEKIDPNLASAGPVLFVATVFIGVATLLLVMDMARRIRRTKMREDIKNKLDAEAAESASA